MIHSVSKKTMKNFRKHKYIKLVATKTRRNYLVSEPNYHTTKYLLTIEMKRNTYILMSKTAYLDLSILEIGKTVIYQFRYNYAKPKYGERPTLCYKGP